MGKSQIPGDWNQCCTCEYWAGRREVYSSSRVLVETTEPGGNGERGKCLKPESGCGSNLQQHSSWCRYWKKWGVLR